MGLADVVEEVLEDADRHATEIEREAEEKSSQIIEEAEEEAEQIIEEARNRAKKEAESLERQELSSAKLEARMKTMTAQRVLLARTRDRALEKLEDLPGEKREELIDKMLEEAEDEMPDGTVYASPKDEELVDDRVGDRFGGTIDAVGGIRVEESGIAMDLTLDSLLESAWEDRLPEVSEALFGG